MIQAETLGPKSLLAEKSHMVTWFPVSRDPFWGIHSGVNVRVTLRWPVFIPCRKPLLHEATGIGQGTYVLD